MPRKKAPAWLPYFSLALFPLVIYWPLSLFNYIVKWDNSDYFFPVRHFISECIRNGVMPSWNPYQYLGMPVAADPQSGFWYPVTWLISLLHGYDVYGSNMDYLLHFMLAGIAMYVFLRGRGTSLASALLFALSYQACGFFASNAQHLAWVISAAWLPLVLHYYMVLLEKPSFNSAIKTALCLAMLLTGGYPAFCIILFYLLLLLLLMKLIRTYTQKDRSPLNKMIGWLAVSSLLFFVMAGGYLFSLMEALQYFARSGGTDLRNSQVAPFAPQCLITFITPFAAAKEEAFLNTNISMTNVYIGLIPLIFCFAGLFQVRQWQLKVLLAFGLFSLLASMGSYTPVRAFLFHYIPLMNYFRFPALFRLFFLIGLFPMGALAMDRWLARDSGHKISPLFIMWLMLLIICCEILYRVSSNGGQFSVPPVFALPQMFTWMAESKLSDRVFFQCVIQLLFLVSAGIAFFLLKGFRTRLSVVIALTIVDLFFAMQLNTPATIISENTFHESQEALSMQPKGFPIYTRPLGQQQSLVRRVPPGWYNQDIFSKVVGGDGYNPFVLSAFEQFNNSPVKDSAFQHPLIYLKKPAGESDVIDFCPDHIVAAVKTELPTSLIFQQTFYPGWKCSIDGMQQQIVPANISEMSVNVPAGGHTVSFEYRPHYLLPALIVCFSSIISALIFLLITYFRSSRV